MMALMVTGICGEMGAMVPANNNNPQRVKFAATTTPQEARKGALHGIPNSNSSMPAATRKATPEESRHKNQRSHLTNVHCTPKTTEAPLAKEEASFLIVGSEKEDIKMPQKSFL